MNNHWLEQQFKNESTEYLEAELWEVEFFGGSIAVVNTLREELARRKGETNEKTEV